MKAPPDESVETANPAAAATAGTDEIGLSVGGMDCASCVAHVEHAAAAVPGVEAVRVNLARGRAAVRFDPGRVTPDRIAAAITDAGYPSVPESPGIAAGDVEE